VTVRQDVPWIDCGKLVTSAGIAAGIDMSLHLVARLAGEQLAHATAKQMEYRWNTHGTDNSASTADSSLYFAA
jgi:transcriptional regulator GlxA family with amidase domain